MNKIIRKLSGLILVILAVTAFGIYSYTSENTSILTNSGVLSNTKIGWGVKRAKDHAQPDLRKNKCKINGRI